MTATSNAAEHFPANRLPVRRRKCDHIKAGGASAKAMLKRDEGILSLRGRWFEWRSADGRLEIPALPTLHPAFLLRQPAAKKKAWSDLLTLAERVDRPERPA